MNAVYLGVALFWLERGHVTYQHKLTRPPTEGLDKKTDTIMEVDFYSPGHEILDKVIIIENLLDSYELPSSADYYTAPQTILEQLDSRESSPEVPIAHAKRDHTRSRTDSAVAIETKTNRKRARKLAIKKEAEKLSGNAIISKTRKRRRVVVDGDVEIVSETVDFTTAATPESAGQIKVELIEDEEQQPDLGVLQAFEQHTEELEASSAFEKYVGEEEVVRPTAESDVEQENLSQAPIQLSEEEDASYEADTDEHDSDGAYIPRAKAPAPISLSALAAFNSQVPPSPKRRGRPPKSATKDKAKAKGRPKMRNAKGTSSTHSVIKKMRDRKKKGTQTRDSTPEEDLEEPIRYNGRGRPASMPHLPCPEGINPRVWYAISYRCQQQRMEGLTQLAEMESEDSDWPTTTDDEADGEEDPEEDSEDEEEEELVRPPLAIEV